MVKSCYQDLRLGASEEKANGSKTGARGSYFRPWWKWAAAGLLILGVLAFLAVRYGDRILSGFVSASVKPLKTRGEAFKAKTPALENKPEQAVAPAPVPSAPEKQSPVVAEEVKPEINEEKKGMPPAPAVERPGPTEVRAGPSEIRAEPAWQTIVVERGDTLGKLASRVYGRSNERVLEIVQKNNPTIKDPDLILPGQKLFFPPISEGTQ
jgi:nucleoid-associated protein YgaU